MQHTLLGNKRHSYNEKTKEHTHRFIAGAYERKEKSIPLRSIMTVDEMQTAIPRRGR